ncbi:MAG: ThiF family adenylyltransferase [Candidatus Methylomirabilales bacterium]
MSSDRFDRNIRFFGREGQERLRSASVAVVGVGGIGTHVVQHLSLLGVGGLALIDPQEMDASNLNRYVGARYDDPIPGTRKVDLGERIAHSIDPKIRIVKVFDSLVSDEAFRAIIESDYLFGCVDREGVRLILNELCAAYGRPYFDVASEIVPEDGLAYGGRVFAIWDGNGCLVCSGVLDLAEAQQDLSRPEGRRDLEPIYGVDRTLLGDPGPSVVSINGVVASLAVTEFMVAVTGIRPPQRLLNYYGHLVPHRGERPVTVSVDEPWPDCYYCKAIRGAGDKADIQRYIRAGVRQWLR